MDVQRWMTTVIDRNRSEYGSRINYRICSSKFYRRHWCILQTFLIINSPLSKNFLQFPEIRWSSKRNLDGPKDFWCNIQDVTYRMLVPYLHHYVFAEPRLGHLSCHSSYKSSWLIKWTNIIFVISKSRNVPTFQCHSDINF